MPLPNVIVFQYNPETITHTWSQAEAVSDEENGNPLAVKGLPAELFSLTIFMDAGDMIADGSPVAEGIARALDRGSDVVYLPWFWRWVMLALKLIPDKIRKRLKL